MHKRRSGIVIASVSFLAGLVAGMLPRLYALGRYLALVITDGDCLNDWLTHL